MHHLSALDALFLQLETPEVPAHVGSVSLLKKPKGHRGSFYRKIREHIEGRLHLAPLFSRRLAFMPLDLANPIWLSGSDLDLDEHITRVVLPKPGTQAQLEAAVAKLHEGMMDRDRPLWQFTVIEGLQGGDVAFYSRIHHAALDGQGGVALAQAILDISPVPRAVDAAVGEEEQQVLWPFHPQTLQRLGSARADAGQGFQTCEQGEQDLGAAHASPIRVAQASSSSTMTPRRAASLAFDPAPGPATR